MNDEKIFEEAKREFEILGIKADNIENIREKDGIALLRISCKNRSFVFKYFGREEYRREIEIYDILRSLEIETVKIFAETEKAILMEDISASENLRLGVKEDLSDPKVAKALAKWYKYLHFAGYGYIDEFGEDFYSENALITKDNIVLIKSKTNTKHLPVWKIIEDNFEKLKSIIESEKMTFNYNDFYYTNLVVAKDKSKAFMFDYNLLGKGAAVSDINNVCWSLSDEAAKAFLKEYGCIDEREKLIEEVAMPLSSLCLACKRDVFPDWGTELLNEIKGDYINKVKTLLEL